MRLMSPFRQCTVPQCLCCGLWWFKTRSMCVCVLVCVCGCGRVFLCLVVVVPVNVGSSVSRKLWFKSKLPV